MAGYPGCGTGHKNANAQTMHANPTRPGQPGFRR